MMILVNNVDRAWQFCTENRGMLGLCGCFHCEQTFNAREITRWVDQGVTAICPRCGIDSVLPGERVCLDPEFLRAMNKRYFETFETQKVDSRSL